MEQRAREKLIDFSILTDRDYIPNWHHEEIAKALESVERGEIKRLMIFMPPRHGKQIANDVLVMTDSGWKKHGQLKVGDKVINDKGEFVKVLAVGEKNSQDVRVWFSGNIFIDCHENHEWRVYDRSENRYRILETKQIKKYEYFSGNRSRFKVDYISPIKGVEQELEIHPYLLGVWLGDGKSSGGSICFHKKDREHINRIKELGYKTGNEWGNDLRNITILGIRKDLRKLRLLNDKHIPFKYLISTEEQRRELLRGLIDTDGSIEKDNRVRFVNINYRLINDVKVLIESLGYRTCITKQKACLSTSGIRGKSDVYTVSFSPHDDQYFGYVKRKSKKIKCKKRLRGITNIERINESQGNCIQVEGGIYCITENFILTHNSQLATINFPAWYLGRNPKKEIITASYSGDLAVEFGGKTRDVVNDEIYQGIFTDTKLRADDKSKSKWTTNKKGSYTSVGVGGAITGKGANILIIDDPIKNREEADSKIIREKIWSWYTSTARTRLEKDAAIIVIQTRWHLDDLAGRLKNQKEEGITDWTIIDFPAIATKDEENRRKGEALWKDKYDIKELKQIKKEIGIYDWTALYQQKPVLTENQEFKQEWFQYSERTIIERVAKKRYLTIDTAMSKSDNADFTGFCENYIDGANNWHLSAYGLKLDAKELVDYILTLHNKKQFDKIGIEKTAYTWGLKPYLDDQQRLKDVYLPIVELDHRQVAKETRIRGLIPRYSSGSIYHFHNNECLKLEEELLTFPKSINDDISDATAYQLQIAKNVKNQQVKTYQPKIHTYGRR